MLQPLNQWKPAFQTQNRAGAFEHTIPAASGTPGEQSKGTGLAPEQIVPDVTNSEETEARQIGKEGKRNRDSFECQTCKNRKYKDGSNDLGVSFKTPTRLSPEKAASAVRSHEQEHVSREQAKAQREDREVVSQSVTYHTSLCPECGKIYVSGGTTKTVTKGNANPPYGQGSLEEKGKYLDLTA